MSQLAGWRFLELGRRIERAIATCRFVRQFAFAELDGALDVLLELADSQITYRLRYVMVAAPAPVIDLVVLDPNNPRSVAYQLGPHRDPSRRPAASAATTAACRRPNRSRPRSRRNSVPPTPPRSTPRPSCGRKRR